MSSGRLERICLSQVSSSVLCEAAVWLDGVGDRGCCLALSGWRRLAHPLDIPHQEQEDQGCENAVGAPEADVAPAATERLADKLAALRERMAELKAIGERLLRVPACFPGLPGLNCVAALPEPDPPLTGSAGMVGLVIPRLQCRA